MQLGKLLVFTFVQTVLCELKHYVTNEHFMNVTHTQKLIARTEFMCADFCVRKGCSTIDYEEGELK